MTIQTDFRTVTDRITAARRALAEAEETRIMARLDLAKAETDLDVTRRQLMTAPDAGSNENARRAFAESMTRDEELHLNTLKNDLAYVERSVIVATTALRIAEDERRYLELVAKLAIAGADDAADGRPELAYATEDADAFTF